MKNFHCKKCSTLVQTDSMPTTSGCPAGGSHSWTTLGKVGSKNYQCKKCATLVHVDSMPTTSGCPSGGSHSWTRL